MREWRVERGGERWRGMGEITRRWKEEGERVGADTRTLARSGSDVFGQVLAGGDVAPGDVHSDPVLLPGNREGEK